MVNEATVRDRYRLYPDKESMMIETTDTRPLTEIRRATLLSDGSVAIHYRDGNGAWDTVVSKPGSMVAEKAMEFFAYAEDI